MDVGKCSTSSLAEYKQCTVNPFGQEYKTKSVESEHQNLKVNDHCIEL